MSYTIEKVLDIARSQIGYHEKASNAYLDDFTANAGSNNYTKYARDLYEAGYYQASKQGQEYCDMFNDWVHLQAANGDPVEAQRMICQSGPYGAGCVHSAQYYKNAGRYTSTDPQPGDQIFFGDYDHTGIVEKVTPTTITTIEGNADNQVKRITYSRNDSWIKGFGRPLYDGSTMDCDSDSRPVLSEGDCGPKVKELQEKLIKLGYSCGSAGADGDFGPSTTSAVKKFQAEHGLVPDGIVGEKTWAALDASLNVSKPAPKPSAPAPQPSATKREMLSRGDSGAQVKELQESLIKLGYSCGSAGADGVFGTGTFVAVQKFQREEGLVADGIVGEKTWAALDDALRNNRKNYTVLCRGDAGSEVKILQQYLIQLGYSCGGRGADGEFGAGTFAAVRKFQSDNGLVVDGVVGKATWTALEKAINS